MKFEFEFEFDNEGDLSIKNGPFAQFNIPNRYIDDLISFTRSNIISKDTRYVCTIGNFNEPDCVIDTGDIEDCTQAELHNYSCREECPYWKEIFRYQIKE